jgi:hypothetical protein
MVFPTHRIDPFAPLVTPLARRQRRWGTSPVRQDVPIRRPATWGQPRSEVDRQAVRIRPEAVSPLAREAERLAPPAADGAPAPPSPATEARPDADVDQQRLREALRELEAAKQRVERDARRDAEETALLQGVKLVRAQLEQTLMDYGVERIRSVGERFDPALHEAVDVIRVETESHDGVVIQEWAAGYRFGDRVLRAAKVRVGKLP